MRLTDQGRQVALEVLRHHRLLELFLAQELGMSWDRVHAEAEVLEHVLSEELEQLLAARLGNPAVDPHGDPIPTPEFEIDEGPTSSLDELPVGAAGRFVRVSDSDPEMLRYLADHGITLTPVSTSSIASRSVGRCSCASASASSRSAASWHARCGSRPRGASGDPAAGPASSRA